jgi:hypothetical protein
MDPPTILTHPPVESDPQLNMLPALMNILLTVNPAAGLGRTFRHSKIVKSREMARCSPTTQLFLEGPASTEPG